MPLRGAGRIAVIALVGLTAAAFLWRAADPQRARSAGPASDHRSRTEPPEQERPAVATPDVPFPGSLKEAEVLDNARAVVKNLRLGEGLEIPALTSGQFQLQRMLRVTSEFFPGGYLVLELADEQGRLLAALAMTPGGALVMIEDRRSGGVGPLDLAVVDAKVRARRGRPALSAGYVYFHNTMERGVSFCRPLVAVRTENGTIYLNSRSEAFADEAATAARDAAEATSERVALATGLRLVPMGRW